ncbi:MAG: DMT family transporter [Microbacteriaceae bacterium]|nr:DMT family transporter [Microbacteriaceae bacterium]
MTTDPRDDAPHEGTPAPIVGSSLTPMTGPIPILGMPGPAPEDAAAAPARPRASRPGASRPPRDLFAFLDRVDARLLAVLASIAVGFGPVLMVLSGENAATVVLFRFGVALVPLAVLAFFELRRNGPMARRHVWMHLLGGAFFGLDLGLWTPGMLMAGAGVATVAGNLQIIIVPVFAWLVFGERIRRPFVIAIPVMLVGIVLISGALETSIGGDVVLGVALSAVAGFAYAGYVLIIARSVSPGHAITQALLAGCTSLVVGTGVASFFGAPTLAVDARPLVILLVMAIVGQFIGWLATTVALPRLDAATGSTLLLMQPVTAVLGGLLVLGERISVLQWVGIVAIVAAAWGTAIATGRSRGVRVPGRRRASGSTS